MPIIWGESWKKLEGYKFTYAVSDCGRVSKYWNTKHKKGVTLCSTSLGGNGYLGVRLSIPRPKWRKPKTELRTVHRLVMITFKGLSADESKYWCCHFDGNKENNHISNLRWDTPSGNMKDKIRHGTSSRGIKNWNTILTERQVLTIRLLGSSGNYYRRELAEKYKVSTTNIDAIIQRRSWSHI